MRRREGTRPAARLAHHTVKLAALAILLVFGIDQAAKVWVRANVPIGHVTELVPGLFDLTHAPNRGIALSTFADLPANVRVPLLLMVPLLVTMGMLVYFLRNRAKVPAGARVAFVLILGGALGNLLDRTLFGEVTDFLRFRLGSRVLFVNNFADDFITVGGVLLACFGVCSPGWRSRVAPTEPASTTT